MSVFVKGHALGATLLGGLVLLLAAAGCQPLSELEPVQGRLAALSGEGPPPGYISGTIPPAYQGRANPFSLQDANAIRQGRVIYTTGVGSLSCFHCHGANGLGDGPRALKMDQLPASFAAPALRDAFRHQQDYVYWWVSAGVDRTVMPGFQDVLTEEEIWQAITYAWYLGEESTTREASWLGKRTSVGR